MSVIEGLVAYLRSCPLVAEAECREPYIDLTASDPASPAAQTAGRSIKKQYLDGTEVIEANYPLHIRRQTDGNPVRREQTFFLEEFRDWVAAQNRAHSFPEIGEERTVRHMEMVGGIPLAVSDGAGEYQIQIKIIYLQKGRNV